MTISVKKALALILSAVIIVCAMAGCSAKEEEPSTTAPITTDSAVIKEADAINLIKTYTAQQLGLEGSLEDYRIMVGSSGEEVEGKYYIKVIASKVSEPGADGTVTIDTYGQYFISYDGTSILNFDETNNTYTPFAEVHSVPQSEESSHSHTHNE